MFCSTIPRKVTEFWVWHGNHWILNCHGIMSIELHGNDMVGVTIHQINLMLSVQLKLLRCQNSEQQFDSLISYRDRIESNLQFLGLLILQNAVKPQSYPVIRTLQNADIRTVMVTGKTYISHKRLSLDIKLLSLLLLSLLRAPVPAFHLVAVRDPLCFIFSGKKRPVPSLHNFHIVAIHFTAKVSPTGCLQPLVTLRCSSNLHLYIYEHVDTLFSSFATFMIVYTTQRRQDLTLLWDLL